MTLQELYVKIDGDYEQALKVMRIEKLIDKHIRRFPSNTIFADLEQAKGSMDANAIFESTHAIKGVCSNLGLVKMANLASEVCDDFRPGNERNYTNHEICEKISLIEEMFKRTSEMIHEYEQ